MPTVDLGDRGASINLPDPLDKILWQVLLGWERPGQSSAVRGAAQPGDVTMPSPCQPCASPEG